MSTAKHRTAEPERIEESRLPSGGDEAKTGRDPLRLAAARMAADYIWRAQAWACEVDEELVVDLEQVHQRILERIHDNLPHVAIANQVA